MNKYTRIKEEFINFRKDVLSNKWYYICLFFFNFVAYGFSMFNRTLSLDDLAYSYFLVKDHAMIAGMRWGIELFNFLIPSEYTPFINEFLSFFLMIIAAILLSFLFYCVKKSSNVISYILLSCFLSTYPLINEMYEFFSYIYSPIFLNLVIISLVIQYFDRRMNIKNILVPGIIMSIVMAGGEDATCTYISLVFIILYLDKSNKKSAKTWLIDGLMYAAPLFIAFVIREVFGNILLLVLNIDYSTVGNYSVSWFSGDIKEAIFGILMNGWYYIIRGLSYFPILEFDIALIIFIAISIKETIKSKNPNYVLIGILLLISLFTLSIIQGEHLHYRTAQTIYVFIPFVVYLLINDLSQTKKALKMVVLILLFFVELRQSIYLHELLALNNQRSDNEAYVARSIGYKIYSEFDKDKTVVFCGEYQIGNFIEEQITVKDGSFAKKIEDEVRTLIGHEENRKYQEFVATNINSYINKQMDAFDGQVMLKKYLSYFGYDINVLEDLNEEEEKKLKGYYELIAKEQGMKPYEIKDMGDYILVYLGPTVDGYSDLEYK